PLSALLGKLAAPLRSAWSASMTRNSACCPLAECSITHGAILLAGAGTERGCAEALPSANTASVIVEKQSSTPIKTRSLKNPPSARLRRTSLDVDFFFIGLNGAFRY